MPQLGPADTEVCARTVLKLRERHARRGASPLPTARNNTTSALHCGTSSVGRASASQASPSHAQGCKDAQFDEGVADAGNDVPQLSAGCRVADHKLRAETPAEPFAETECHWLPLCAELAVCVARDPSVAESLVAFVA